MSKPFAATRAFHEVIGLDFGDAIGVGARADNDGAGSGPRLKPEHP
jgi:hypothetical protein